MREDKVETHLNHNKNCYPHSSHLAATARRFLALAAPGSTDRDLAASRSLLDAMEMFLRLPMTWIWSSLLWKKTKVKVNRYKCLQLDWEHSRTCHKQVQNCCY